MCASMFTSLKLFQFFFVSKLHLATPQEQRKPRAPDCKCLQWATTLHVDSVTLHVQVCVSLLMLITLQGPQCQTHGSWQLMQELSLGPKHMHWRINCLASLLENKETNRHRGLPSPCFCHPEHVNSISSKNNNNCCTVRLRMTLHICLVTFKFSGNWSGLLQQRAGLAMC